MLGGRWDNKITHQGIHRRIVFPRCTSMVMSVRVGRMNRLDNEAECGALAADPIYQGRFSWSGWTRTSTVSVPDCVPCARGRPVREMICRELGIRRSSATDSTARPRKSSSRQSRQNCESEAETNPQTTTTWPAISTLHQFHSVTAGFHSHAGACLRLRNYPFPPRCLFPTHNS